MARSVKSGRSSLGAIINDAQSGNCLWLSNQSVRPTDTGKRLWLYKEASQRSSLPGSILW